MRKWMFVLGAAAALAAAVWRLWQGERELHRPFTEDFASQYPFLHPLSPQAQEPTRFLRFFCVAFPCLPPHRMNKTVAFGKWLC